MKRLVALLGAVLVAGAVLAGCGSSKSSSGTTAAAPAGSSGTTTSTPATGARPTGTTAEAAIKACKQAIHAQSTLPASAKSKLEAVCPKAVAGDKEAVRKAAGEVCEEVINKGAIPEGPAKQAALRACKAK